ncbi:alkaline phosphatase [Arundinibacter roseus]|uniref:Alkaline phosphatase n=1 Tax=Arundinibacter roseus TaxID=2070510 RepID=A0A4R4K870_9BACT|nr:alkaline phosphatase [Arundinibacter roseus]TDB62756.1 alkaline phosphatase [Arundinibacter roseus]
MNKKIIFLLLLLLLGPKVGAQDVNLTGKIHAHNDYVQPIPFYNAYHQRVGSIEADLFLGNGQLYVAHTLAEIQPDQTLEKLYLLPLKEQIKKNQGSVYREPIDKLQFLIDLKTDGETTLPALVNTLNKYPEIINSPTIQIVISGNKPSADTWSQFPAYINFDGNPGQKYTHEQLRRVALISDSFRNYTQWNGKGILVKPEREKITQLIQSVHQLNKPFRFWATPDNVNTWQTLMHLGVDYLGTDDVVGLAGYLKKIPSTTYQHRGSHAVYTPKYVNNDLKKKVKNVILMIGDGMGLAQIYAGYTAAAGQLNLFNFLNIGFSRTSSADSYLTDSAAGATAMATGQKTNNRYIGVDTNGTRLATIPELISSKGMKTAIITTGDVTDATPASFYAHQTERNLSAAIAADFVSSPVSILIGGNYAIFASKKNGQDLISTLENKGYATAKRITDLDRVSGDKFVILDDQAMLPEQKGRQDFLVKALNHSLGALTKNEKGFFIVAEGAQIDHGGHQNNTSWMVQEMLDFDKAVGEAMKFVDSDGETLLIVTADHETGGFSLLGGNLQKGYVAGNFSSDDHTAIPVPVFAYGPHSLDFRGVYENTELFNKIMQVINRYH